MNQKLHSWVFIPEKRLCSHKKLYLNILMSFKGCMAKLWDAHSRENYSVPKRNELLIYTTWINLRKSMLSEKNQS